MENKEFPINSIKDKFEKTPFNDIAELINSFETDERKGVQKLIGTYKNKLKSHDDELKRLKLMMKFEEECYKNGYSFVCGIDEVGRGPLAGPVVASAVILPPDIIIENINDSKKLSPEKREYIYNQITEKAISIGTGIISVSKIDEVNILNATIEAMESAILQLNPLPDFLLIDALRLEHCPIPQKGVVHGDTLSASIAAASIIAKVTRDKIMTDYDEVFPLYGFAKHKGYGTEQHINTLKEFGPCPIHRRTFIKNFV